MLLKFLSQSLIGATTLLAISSCGVKPENRVGHPSNLVPVYLIARADIKEKSSSKTSLDFVSVTSSGRISNARDAERAFLAGEPLIQDEAGQMRLASSSDVQFSLGSPVQMQTTGPTQMSARQTKQNCSGPDCGPAQVQTYNNCDCSYSDGVIRSRENKVLFPRLKSFFQKLNPFAKVGDQQYPYNYGNQYSKDQYQYTVFEQPQPSPVTPTSPQTPTPQYQLPYAPQNPMTPQTPAPPSGPTGQEPMPGY
jgi:hypothetical protein